MFLYHYYPRGCEPFRSLSDLPQARADAVLDELRQAHPDSFAARRPPDYMARRRRVEAILREEFRKKGGKLLRDTPHYLTVEHSPFLASWYEDCAILRIPIEEFDLATVSFTYGDSHPTFSDRVDDGREYRKTIYTYPEILRIIDKYGLPQDWNPDGVYGPERYVEAHVWSDDPIDRYRR